MDHPPQQFEVIETSISYDSIHETVNSSLENIESTIDREPYETANSNNNEKTSQEEFQYSSEEDKEAPIKPMGPACNCRLGCYNKVPEETRRRLYDNFWNNCSWIQRKQYVALSITEIPKSRSRCRGPIRTERRQLTCIYSLLVNGELVKVCKGMFLNTLSVSEKFVRLVMSKKRSSTSGIAGMNFKDKQVKKSDAVKDAVREHIRSFPAEVLSGDRSGRAYLDASLNVSAMHKLYVKHCQENGVPANDIVRQGYYREIFNAEFNLGFKCKEVIY